MRAEIISVGTELLMGQIDNTDARYISYKLPECGVYVYYHTVVGDNKTRLAQCLKTALLRTDVVVLTGGLGPTEDDLTKETVAEVLCMKLVFHQELLDDIKSYFDKSKRIMTVNNEKQAYYPEGSIILPNKNGTAAGCLIETKYQGEDKVIILLPGPPWEMESLFNEYVIQYFNERSSEALRSVYIRMFGIGESAMETVIKDMIDNQTNPTIAPYAKKGEVMLRVTVRYDRKNDDADALLKPVLDKLKVLLGEYIYSYDDTELNLVTGRLLIEKGISFSCAESCTGGMLSAMLTENAGISKVFLGSLVAYTNEIKNTMLGVDKSTLSIYGAVSKETAAQMAIKIREKTKSEIGISVTGNAGPGVCSGEMPVGRVYIGFSTSDSTTVTEYTFIGNRDKIRHMACLNALNIMRKYALVKG
ncbi:MAG: competence/damage-inducible protein A [Clostridia bacterium]|jgi:nicotinamide-nucleotide amidase